MAMSFTAARRAEAPNLSGATYRQAELDQALQAAEMERKAQTKSDVMGLGTTALSTVAKPAAAAAMKGGLGAGMAALGPVGWAGLAALGLGALLR